MPSAEFEKAAADVTKLKSKPSNDEMLKLYGLYKQAKGEKFADAKRPTGVFEMAGKAKYDAWEKEKDTSAADAEKQYIELVNKLKSEKGFDG